jgi:hypothetical protein
MKYGALVALLLISGCTGVPREAPPTPALSVFVVAHPDDWQLFMNPAAFQAMNQPHEKAVFVHVSAGDAGRGMGGEPTPYYLAREEGALPPWPKPDYAKLLPVSRGALVSTRGPGAMAAGCILG